jgi:hypothetical protein
MNEKGILSADIFEGRDKYLEYSNGEIIFTQILVVPNLTCSLRCKHCAAGNQYAERKVFDSVQTVNDFNKLMGVCKTKQVNIQGGEVFVNPQFSEFIRLFAEMSNINKCESVAIFTNATVIPNEDQLKAIKMIPLPVKLMISNYDLPSVKINAFISKVEEYGVDYVLFPKDRFWFHPGSPLEKTGFTETELKEVIRRCTKFCRAPKIIDGKFLLCGQNGYALYDILEDVVDVRNCPDSELAEMLYKYVYELDSYDICEYCRGVYEGVEQVFAAEQLIYGECEQNTANE